MAGLHSYLQQIVSAALNDSAAGSRRLVPYCLIALLCFALYLPGIAAIPPTDRDEARYMQAARQMIETGDFTRIFFQDTPRHKKPIAIYWLQALSVKVFSSAGSSSRWPYRLPSLLAATLAVLAVFHFGRRVVSPPTAFLAACVLATTVLLVGEAHLAKTDAALLLCTVLTQLVLGLAYCRRELSRGAALLFWAALGAGVLIKGPVLLGVTGLTVCALLVMDRQRGWLWSLRPFTGIPLALLMVLPWLVSIQSATQGAFLKDSFGSDIVPKFTGVQESHSGFPGYYLVSALATFWPWSLMLGAAIEAARRKWRERAVAFCLAWLVPAWIVLELVPTKLPHYVLPLFPALALLVGVGVRELALDGHVPGRRTSRLFLILWVSITAALALLFAGASFYFSQLHPLATVIVVLLLLSAAALAVQLARRGVLDRAFWQPIALIALSFPVVTAYLFPGLDSFWLSRRIAAQVRALPPENRRQIVVAGYQEPSLVFYLGTRTQLRPPDAAAAAFSAGCGTLAVIEAKERDAFLKQLAAPLPRPLAEVAGFNYSKGKRRTLSFYASPPC